MVYLNSDQLITLCFSWQFLYKQKLPSRYTIVKNIQDVEPAEATEQAEYLQEDRWGDPASACMSSGHGRGGRGRGRGRSRGGRLQRGSGSSRSEFSKENAGNGERTVRGLRRKSRTRGRGRKRGRRTVRSRPRAEKRVIEKLTPLSQFDETCSPRNNSGGQSSRSSEGDEWDVEETRTIKVEGAENSNNVEASESDDNAQVSGDEYDDERGQYYGNLFHGKSEDIMEESEDDFNGDDGDGDGEDGDSDEEGDGDADGDRDEGDGDGDGDEEEEVDGDEEGEMDGDGEENGDEDQEQHGDEDEDTGSMSSDYSD